MIMKEKVISYIYDAYGVREEHVFADSPEVCVFRHSKNRKWFGIIMPVRRELLKLDGESSMDVLNVKCDPLLVGSLIAVPGYLPAYHMNKTHWLSILLDGSVDFEQICGLIDLSFELTE